MIRKIQELRLKYLYIKENKHVKIIHLLFSSTYEIFDKKKRRIKQLDLHNNVIQVWNSISEASRELNISISGISNTCNGRYKTAGGCKWEFID